MPPGNRGGPVPVQQQKQKPFGGQPPQQGLPPDAKMPGATGKPGTKKNMKAPQKLTLPKFPIPGTKLSAREIADMPTNHLMDLFELGTMPPVDQLMDDMDNQEPGILEQLSEQTKAFFEERSKMEEQQHRVQPIRPKIIKKWLKEQSIRIKEHKKRTSDYSEFIRKRGQQVMKPGGPGSKGFVPKAGKPGEINPILKQ